MAMMVRDRTSEVAVMRALGFQRTHIATLLLSEAALIGLSGASLGAVAALVKFGHGVSLGAVTGMLGYMEVRPETALAAVAVALAVSIAAAGTAGNARDTHRTRRRIPQSHLSARLHRRARVA